MGKTADLSATLHRPSRVITPDCDQELESLQSMMDEIGFYGVPKGIRRPGIVTPQKTRSAGGEKKYFNVRSKAIGLLSNKLAAIQTEIMIAQGMIREVQELNWHCQNYSAAMLEQYQLEQDIAEEDRVAKEKERERVENKKRRLSEAR